MKLNEFIKNSLLDINQGLAEANEEYKKSNKSNENAFLLLPGADKEKGSGIHFDLAVTIKKEGKAGAEASINVLAFDLSTGTKGKIASENLNRIIFSVKVNHYLG